MLNPPAWLSTVASIAMAVGPPLVYADQTLSIVKKKDSTGFSRDVCGVLLIANITRVFFWMGEPFEYALLIQSIFMILAQLALLYICILYRPRQSPDYTGVSTRYILIQSIIFLILGRIQLYVMILGFLALGLESALPIPQFVSNYKNQSLYGFRTSTLLGWLGGDAFKTVYFFLQDSPLQFKICAIFQLSIDCAIVVQRLYYGNKPPALTTSEDDLEQALALEQE